MGFSWFVQAANLRPQHRRIHQPTIRIPPAKPACQLKELRRPPGDLRPPLLGARFERWTIGISRILMYLKQTWHVQWDLKDQNSDFEVTNWNLSWNDTWNQWGWLDYAWFQWKLMESIGKLALKWSVPKLYQQSRRIQHPSLGYQEEYLQRWSVHGTSRREYGNSRFASAIYSYYS